MQVYVAQSTLKIPLVVRWVVYQFGTHLSGPSPVVAIAERSFGERDAARAAPPSFPRATAAGFLPEFESSSGSPVSFSPMNCSTVRRATVAKSWSLLERAGMVCFQHEHAES